MTELPASTDYAAADRTEGQCKTFIANLRAYLAGLLGTDGEIATARTALGLGTVAVENILPVAKGGTGGTTQAAARTGLGLGTVATESTVPVAKGGTGATTAGAARTNLGGTAAGQAVFTAADAAAQRTALELGAASTKNTGTSGDAVPLLDGTNTHSGANTFSHTFALSGTVSPVWSADINDFNAGNVTCIVALPTDAHRNLTGLTGGASGRVITIHNISATYNLILKNNVTSTVGNRFRMDADITLAPFQSMTFRYDGANSRWRPIANIGTASVLTASYVSGDLAITAGGLHTLTHGLGGAPKIIQFGMKCLTAEAGYSVGEEIYAAGGMSSLSVATSGQREGFSARITSTQIILRFVDILALTQPHATTGVQTTTTPANWALIVRAFA